MDVKSLIEQLFHNDPARADNARQALLQRGHAVTEALLMALNTPTPFQRERVVEVLGKLENIETTPHLSQVLLGDASLEVRERAAKSLLQLEDVDAVPALARALDDPATNVRLSVIRAIGEYGLPVSAKYLLKKLDDPEADVAFQAASVLATRFQEGKASHFLREFMKYAPDGYQVKIIEGLAALRDEQAVPFLDDSLQHPDVEVRTSAAEGLGKIGNPAILARLIDVLSYDPAPSVRAAAALALGILDDWQAIDALHKALNDPQQEVTAAAAVALGQIHAADSLVPLLTVLERDVLPQTRKQVVRSLGYTGDSAATEALKLLFYDDPDYAVQYSAALALADLANPEAMEILRDALSHTSYLTRQAAAKALGQVRDAMAGDLLENMLRDPDRGVRHLSALALLKINRNHVEPALTLLLEDLYHAEYEVCWYTLRSMQGDPDRRFTNPLLAVMDDSDSDTRALAAEVLGIIGDTRAIPRLVESLRDPVWEVRRAVRLALLKLGHSFEN